MSNRFVASVVAGLLALALPLANVAAQEGARVDVRAVDIKFPEFIVDIRVTDANGRSVIGLDKRNIQIIEDSTTTLAPTKLEQQLADTSSPTRTFKLSDGKTDETLFTVGAAIGVVFDATTALNAGDTGGHNFLDEGRRAIEQFLLQAGPQAPLNPETISLFLPITSPEQQVQPPEFANFTQDRNTIINYMRQMTPREGRTNLYAAIQQAVGDTAAVAQQRGSDALVLVVGDGGDTISDDSFDSIIEQARANQVKIVTFGVGSDKSLIDQEGGFRLNQLASATGGVYLQRPDDAAASAAFSQVVTATPASLYTIRYTTGLLDDGKQHSFVVKVTLPDGTISSQPVTFNMQGLISSTSTGDGLRPLNEVLLRQYLLIAVPAALLISLAAVLLMGGMRWRKSLALSKSQTKR